MPDYDDWQKEAEAEALAEYQADDAVHRNIRFVSFVSKSKGGQSNKVVRAKNGKTYGPYPKYGPYKRRNWKEVELVSYNNGPFISWHKFPFDTVATECIGDIEDSEGELMKRVREL